MNKNKHFVYVLKSEKDNKLYTGYTAWLELRIKQHNEGFVKSTRHRRPFKLIYYEEFTNKKEAQTRERFFKTGQGRSFLKTKLDTAA